LLRAERTASAVLQRPGAASRLLDVAARSADADEWGDALLRALRSVALPPAASLDELRRLLRQARSGCLRLC
jgi:hypothetical protein